ncbi:MAG: transposase [Caldilineaceae bacterium SB0666_bin_21]|nr:transposase [Caldilineaceae bacterium SB0666_bin_21]
MAATVSLPKPDGRPLTYPRREIVKAIRHAFRTGCVWWTWPHDPPPWRMVHHYFRTW